jgi:quinol monooxygenase YgiN
MSLIRIVRMTFKEESIELFLQQFNFHKEQIRHFPGCRHLELWKDGEEKNIFLTYSIWESREALEQYRDSELFKSVWGKTKPLFSEKPVAFSSKKIIEVV